MPESRIATLVMCDTEMALYIETTIKRIPSPSTERQGSDASVSTHGVESGVDLDPFVLCPVLFGECVVDDHTGPVIFTKGELEAIRRRF